MKRGENLRAFNNDPEHQRRAGLARAAQPGFIEHCRRIAPDGWWAFSAYWRVHQGLPLLDPLQVQFLTPDDFCGPDGRPLPKREQRRLLRAYLKLAAERQIVPSHIQHRSAVSAPYIGGDIACVRLAHRWASSQLHPEYVYGGRDDIRPYESESLAPTRPYGVPVSHSETFEGYWMHVAPDAEQDDVYSPDDIHEWGNE